jgi:hypothetical protein
MGDDMHVVVTGGAGFIGANLVRALVWHPVVRSVRVIDDLSTGRRDNLDGLPVSFYEGSILDELLMDRVLTDADAVVHLAARPSVPRSVRDPVASHVVNATGTLAVLDKAGLRHAGLHADLVERHVAELGEHLLHEVVPAGAHAAARDDEVGMGQRPLERLGDRPTVVGDDVVAEGDGTGLPGRRGQRVRVRVPDLPGPPRLSRRHELVAPENGQPGPAYATGCMRSLGAYLRPTLAHGRPSTITTSAVKSLSPRMRLEPTPYASTGTPFGSAIRTSRMPHTNSLFDGQ